MLFLVPALARFGVPACFVTLVAIVALTSCNDDGDEQECKPRPVGEFVALIDHTAWEPLPADDDPLAAHRPELIECSIAGWYIEEGKDDLPQLEINTNYCNYVALHQPTLAAIDGCGHFRLSFYHFDLTAPEPAEAHVALLVDGELLWEAIIEIPSNGEVGKAQVWDKVEFEAPFAAPAGADLVLHVHNHGQNTYTLIGLEAEIVP